MINTELLEKYKSIVKHPYIPIENSEYQIRLSDEYIRQNKLDSIRIYIAIAHCEFRYVIKDFAYYFPLNICKINPIFYEQYIKTNIFELEEIQFDKIFTGEYFIKNYNRYHIRSSHITQEEAKLLFDEDIINQKFYII